MAKKIKKEDLYAIINNKQSNKSIEDLLRSHASLDALMNTTVQVVNTRIPPETKRTETNAKEETNSIYIFSVTVRLTIVPIIVDIVNANAVDIFFITGVKTE